MIHLQKLCVGTTAISDLICWRDRSVSSWTRQDMAPHMHHVTRAFPKRHDELLDGGSLYWVVKGHFIIRQEIAALEPLFDQDGIRRCRILLKPVLIPTQRMPRRPFQGWRYLRPQDAPADETFAIE